MIDGPKELIHKMLKLELNFTHKVAEILCQMDNEELDEDEAWDAAAQASMDRVLGWGELERDYPRAFTASARSTQ